MLLATLNPAGPTVETVSYHACRKLAVRVQKKKREKKKNHITYMFKKLLQRDVFAQKSEGENENILYGDGN